MRQTKEAYGDSWQSVFFEQYKMYVESADKISERRTVSNNYLLTVNAALATIYGVTSDKTDTTVWHIIVLIAGTLTCVVWWYLIRSYRELNTVKFEVIHELEEYLPVALYEYEWTLAKHGQGKSFRPMSHLERYVPLIFIAMYIFIAICLSWQSIIIPLIEVLNLTIIN